MGGVDVYVDTYFLDLGTSWRWVVNFTPLPLYRRGKPPGTHWIGGWLGLRTDLEDAEKRKYFTLPGLELRPLCCLARSQSLYRLRYPGSAYFPYFEKRIKKAYEISLLSVYLFMYRSTFLLLCIPSLISYAFEELMRSRCFVCVCVFPGNILVVYALRVLSRETRRFVIPRNSCLIQNRLETQNEEGGEALCKVWRRISAPQFACEKQWGR
jgi:hypothetical protein